MKKLKEWLSSFKNEWKRESVMDQERRIRFRYVLGRVENRWVGFDFYVSPSRVSIDSQIPNNGYIAAYVLSDRGQKIYGYAALDDVSRLIPKRLG